MTPLEQSQQVLMRIAKRFNQIKWIWVLSTDGLPLSGLGGTYIDISDILHDTNIDEKAISDIQVTTDYSLVPNISVIMFSMMERVSQDISLKVQRFTIISDKQITLFVIPIGSGTECFLSIAINEYSSISDIIQCVPDSEELAELESIWSR